MKLFRERERELLMEIRRNQERMEDAAAGNARM